MYYEITPDGGQNFPDYIKIECSDKPFQLSMFDEDYNKQHNELQNIVANIVQTTFTTFLVGVVSSLVGINLAGIEKLKAACQTFKEAENDVEETVHTTRVNTNLQEAGNDVEETVHTTRVNTNLQEAGNDVRELVHDTMPNINSQKAENDVEELVHYSDSMINLGNNLRSSRIDDKDDFDEIGSNVDGLILDTPPNINPEGNNLRSSRIDDKDDFDEIGSDEEELIFDTPANINPEGISTLSESSSGIENSSFMSTKCQLITICAIIALTVFCLLITVTANIWSKFFSNEQKQNHKLAKLEVYSNTNNDKKECHINLDRDGCSERNSGITIEVDYKSNHTDKVITMEVSRNWKMWESDEKLGDIDEDYKLTAIRVRPSGDTSCKNIKNKLTKKALDIQIKIANDTVEKNSIIQGNKCLSEMRVTEETVKTTLDHTQKLINKHKTSEFTCPEEGKFNDIKYRFNVVKHEKDNLSNDLAGICQKKDLGPFSAKNINELTELRCNILKVPAATGLSEDKEVKINQIHKYHQNALDYITCLENGDIPEYTPDSINTAIENMNSENNVVNKLKYYVGIKKGYEKLDDDDKEYIEINSVNASMYETLQNLEYIIIEDYKFNPPEGFNKFESVDACLNKIYKVNNSEDINISDIEDILVDLKAI